MMGVVGSLLLSTGLCMVRALWRDAKDVERILAMRQRVNAGDASSLSPTLSHRSRLATSSRSSLTAAGRCSSDQRLSSHRSPDTCACSSMLQRRGKARICCGRWGLALRAIHAH